MKKTRMFSMIIAAFFISVFVGIIAKQPAHAEMAEVAQKWIFSQYYHCLQGGELNRQFDRKNHTSGEVANTIFPKGGSDHFDYSRLPSEGYFTSVGETSINCYQVIRGIDGKISGILEAAGAPYNVTWNNLSNTDEVLSKLGYEAEDAEATVFFKILLNEHNETTVTTIFSNTSVADFERGSARIEGVRGADGHITWRVAESNLFNEVKVNIDGSNRLIVKLDTPGWIAGCSSTGDFTSGQIQLTDDVETTKRNIVNEIGGYTANAYCSNTVVPSGGVGIPTTTQSNITYSFSADTSGLIDEGEGSIFSNDGSEQTALKSLISLGRGFSSLKLSDDERYDLYKWYLDKAIPDLNSSDRTKCQDYENSEDLKHSLQEIHLKSGDKWYVYYVNVSGVDLDTSKYNDIEPGAVFTTKSLKEIIAWMNEHEAEKLTAEDCTPPTPSGGISNTTVNDAESSEVDCFNAAGSLGWILCPVIEFTQHTITAIYGSIVENFLEFRAEWLDIGGQGESVYQAWQTFQSFANIIFVIVLLVVIFSQLTGVGIDNLGIKRVLPKLIIAAILINLSYLICMLFVDISNILGVGFNNIFSNIIVSIDGGSSAGTGAQVLTTVVTGAVAGAVGFLALNPVTVGIFGSVIVIPLVLGLIGVLVGVLFFFILLGARQAGIIMLVVASPIAFACYMLPNTKTIFDKWLKMFEGLLLLFPICGLLMGGSAFASKVLLTVDTGFLGTLIAMLVGVIPFFFIPTLLRGAFSAMGNLGARISGIGQNISRGLGRAAAGSDTMKDFQTRMRAGIDRNGNLTRAGEARMRIARGEGRLGKVSALRQRVGRAQLRSLAAYEKMQDEVDLASRPDLLRSEAEAKRFSRRQAAADSELVSSGVANRTGDVKDFVAGQSSFEEGTLTYAAMRAAQDGDVEMQYATAERMLAQGHHGAEAYRQVLATLEAQGDTAALENFAKAAKGSRYLGDLKSGARSTFDYVSAIADNKVTRDENNNRLSSVATGNTLNDYTNKVKYSNMSEAQVIGMDREELSRAAEIIRQKRQSGEAFTKEEESLISQANKAFRNDRLRGSAKESNQKLAAEIAGISEAEQRRIVGDRIDIDRNSENGNDGNGESAASNSTSNSGSSTSPTPNQTPSSSTASTQAQASNSAPTPPPAPTPSPAPSRGNMTDEQLQKLRGFYQRKVNNNTATPEDRRTLNRINNELDLRETGYSRDEGTPV